MLIGALLYAGPEAAIDASDACRFHGVKAVTPDEARVHVVVPAGSRARSRGYVVVRRAVAPIRFIATDRLRYVDAPDAAIAATRLMSQRRRVLAAMSDALQRRVTTYDDLVRAHVQGPPRNTRLADDALESLGAGTRSVPEADFRALVEASVVLPSVEFNVWLRLGSGEDVCVDALVRSSALIHETNGRIAHAREDLFEDMQRRHDALTANGFVVLHNSPDRIRRRGREVLAQVERCHQLYAGRGMPAGVDVRRERRLTML
jgi:very-short-patch-repair endonuclease